ncbi:MAG: DUF732 domain-containing protein [Mycobacterium sp.]
MSKLPVTSLAVSSLAVLTVAWLVCGCSQGRSMVATMALPNDELNQAELGGPDTYMAPSKQQHEFLDALDRAGVRPSSDLSALTIASSVCQARAAGQGDQAVWDFVEPLVRGDLDTSDQSSAHPSQIEVDAATASYIRIATERLC